ncbi:MAG: site-specific integrase [Lachnospiraceae bacterium]|nr:site-specific integrase [Lachnospiraceae bacterium]
MEKYILPYIGEIPASLFNADILSEILAFLKQENDIKKTGKEESFSQYTLYLIENIVRAMCRYGAEKGIMPEISFGQAEYRIKSKKEALPLSELEMHQLACVIDKQEMDVQLQVLLPLYTGISLSELCGLKWKDIDLKNGKIHIHRNLVRIQQKTGNLKSNSKKNKIFEDNSRNTTNDKKSGKIQPATIIAECELPEKECHEFIIPEKLHNLLKVIYENKKPPEESYVVEVDKKIGNKKEAVVEKIKCKETSVIKKQ